MVDFNFEDSCYGCGACANVCPVDAIAMKSDERGFLIPEISKDRCVSCGQCDKVCISSVHTAQAKNVDDKKAFLYVHPNADVLERSASGGGFSVLAEKILACGGYVCGCVFDSDMKAVHIVSNTKSDISRMHGSKYVQSDITGCFNQIRDLLKKKTLVLFCGTPCQCAAIQSVFKGKENEFLYTVAIICHGVPSPKVWRKWKEHLEKKMKSPMCYANHRAKGKNYNTPESIYTFENGNNLRQATYLEDLYCYAFSTDVFLRNTCYRCKYKENNITADVIIGDYFDFRENSVYTKGVSSVVINTEKGKKLFGRTAENAKEIKILEVVEKNKALVKPVQKNQNRDRFFDDMEKWGIQKAIKRNIPYTRFLIKKCLYKARLFEQLRKVKR